MGLPQYPPLPGNVDPQRIEEIRRTVYVANLDPTVTPEQVLNFFSQVKLLYCISLYNLVLHVLALNQNGQCGQFDHILNGAYDLE